MTAKQHCKILFADFLALVPADVGLPRSSVAQTSQVRPDFFSRWDTELSHTVDRSRRRGSRQLEIPSHWITVTAAYRGQATSTNELRAGVIGRVAALLPLPRVTIPTSLLTVSISILISCHNTCITPCIKPMSSPSSVETRWVR